MCIQYPIINNKLIIILILSFGALFLTTPPSKFYTWSIPCMSYFIQDYLPPHGTGEQKCSQQCEVLVMPKRHAHVAP